MRNHIFKIGDIVKLNADTITKSFGELPNWFNNKSINKKHLILSTYIYIKYVHLI